MTNVVKMNAVDLKLPQFKKKSSDEDFLYLELPAIEISEDIFFSEVQRSMTFEEK